MIRTLEAGTFYMAWNLVPWACLIVKVGNGCFIAFDSLSEYKAWYKEKRKQKRSS